MLVAVLLVALVALVVVVVVVVVKRGCLVASSQHCVSQSAEANASPSLSAEGRARRIAAQREHTTRLLASEVQLLHTLPARCLATVLEGSPRCVR